MGLASSGANIRGFSKRCYLSIQNHRIVFSLIKSLWQGSEPKSAPEPLKTQMNLVMIGSVRTLCPWVAAGTRSQHITQ